jgi:hypothetical protein
VVLPLPPLGVVVVVLVLPVCAVVMSRTCLAALSQHLPWLTLAEGVVVVVEVWALATPIPAASNAATAIVPVLIISDPFGGSWRAGDPFAPVT